MVKSIYHYTIFNEENEIVSKYIMERETDNDNFTGTKISTEIGKNFVDDNLSVIEEISNDMIGYIGTKKGFDNDDGMFIIELTKECYSKYLTK